LAAGADLAGSGQKSSRITNAAVPDRHYRMFKGDFQKEEI